MNRILIVFVANVVVIGSACERPAIVVKDATSFETKLSFAFQKDGDDLVVDTVDAFDDDFVVTLRPGLGGPSTIARVTRGGEVVWRIVPEGQDDRCSAMSDVYRGAIVVLTICNAGRITGSFSANSDTGALGPEPEYADDPECAKTDVGDGTAIISDGTSIARGTYAAGAPNCTQQPLWQHDLTDTRSFFFTGVAGDTVFTAQDVTETAPQGIRGPWDVRFSELELATGETMSTHVVPAGVLTRLSKGWLSVNSLLSTDVTRVESRDAQGGVINSFDLAGATLMTVEPRLEEVAFLSTSRDARVIAIAP